MAIKVLQNGSGFSSDVVAGIDYVVSIAGDFNDLAVINLSLGGSLYSECPCDSVSSTTQLYSVAAKAAHDVGIAVFSSTGNEAACDAMDRPSCVSNVIAVAAIYDSNLGGLTWQQCTDVATGPDQVLCISNRSSCNQLAAPGADISAPAIGGGVESKYGTSMASPHCAGVAALLRERYPALTPSNILQAMLETGAPTSDPCSTNPNPVRVDASGAINWTAPVAISDVSPDPIEPVVVDGVPVVILTGSGFDYVVSVTIDGVELAETEWGASSNTSVQVNIPLQSTLGPIPLELITATDSAFASVTLVENDPPVVEMLGSTPGVLLNEIGFDVTMGGEVGSICFLRVSTDLVPSTLPGIVDYGIGSFFLTLWSLGNYIIPSQGWKQIQFPTSGIPFGTIVHVQSAHFGSGGLPLVSTNIQTGVFLF